MCRARLVLLLCFLLCLMGCGSGKTAVPPTALVITNGTVFTGTDAPPIPDGMVVVEQNRITGVGPSGDFRLPDGVRVIDAQGGTILPGLINAHVHFCSDTAVRRRFLEHGVTAVCDLGTSANLVRFYAQMATAAGEPVARGFTTGQMVTAVGGYPSQHPNQWTIEVDSPDAGAAAVSRLVEEGASMIKVCLEPGDPVGTWPVLGPDTLHAIADAAHARGLPVRVHLHDAGLLESALDAGADTIEHLPLPFCLQSEAAAALAAGDTRLADWPTLEAQYRRMAAQGVILVPTLDAQCFFADEMLGTDKVTALRLTALSEDIVRAYRDMGGRIAVGNDYGAACVDPDLPLHELELLHSAGLSNADVLRAATRNAAAACGQARTLGTLEPGKLADILIVTGDPLADLQALSDVRAVVSDGVVLVP